MAIKTYSILPVPKCRMTQRDKWLNPPRPPVARYRAFKDRVQKLNIQLPQPCKIVFYLPMPKSWSKKKRAQMIGQPHTQKIDVDNLIKSVMDSVYKDDAHIWSIWGEKRWSDVPKITVEELHSDI